MAKFESVRFRVSDQQQMHYGGCAKRRRNRPRELIGVQRVGADIDTQFVIVAAGLEKITLEDVGEQLGVLADEGEIVSWASRRFGP